ncbi:hypothetical protein [Desulfotruncus arcticus]|uniref:hypothetical protein n=1 Tax=Desulfotruncus arcticus TaxID=341036 RepID=UPI000B860456|nr:hypothetical protein [Desulfotruncus arcticus]
MKKKSLSIYTHAASVDTVRKSGRFHKPRDPEEDLTLFMLDKIRWQKALASGRIEKIGPRRYRWNE